MNCDTEVAGTALLTTMMFGVVPIRASGVASLSGS
jgi:hypothetical protein